MSIESLIDDFSFLDGWEDRYKYLIELGGQLPRFSDEQKKDEWKVPGCQSQVWIIPHYSENGISFEGDSDAIIVRGIIAVVLEIFIDKSAQENLDIDDEEIFVDFGTSISPCIIRPVDEEGDYTYMILPIKLKD